MKKPFDKYSSYLENDSYRLEFLSKFVRTVKKLTMNYESIPPLMRTRDRYQTKQVLSLASHHLLYLFTCSLKKKTTMVVIFAPNKQVNKCRCSSKSLKGSVLLSDRKNTNRVNLNVCIKFSKITRTIYHALLSFPLNLD